MTTMMLASMMMGAKIGDEPSSPKSVTAKDNDGVCRTIAYPVSSFLPRNTSDGDLSAVSIENDNVSGAGRRGAPDRTDDGSSSTLGDVDEPFEQLVAVNFDKADLVSGSGGIRKSTSMVSFHSSCLKKSPSRSSLAGSNKGGMRRVNSNVSFGSVSVREHERVVDDRPALPGPALGLGWAYNQKDDVHLDEYKPSKDGDEEGQTTTPAPAKEKKYVEQHLSSFARSVKLRSYGFEYGELKTEAQKAREAMAEGKRMAELAKRKKEQKKLSYKFKKALGVVG